jgi:hypothetical protein
VADIAIQNGITLDDIMGESRRGPVVRARWEAILVVREEFPGWSLAKIARFFRRDHTTVIHALRKMEHGIEPVAGRPRYRTDEELREYERERSRKRRAERAALRLAALERRKNWIPTRNEAQGA